MKTEFQNQLDYFLQTDIETERDTADKNQPVVNPLEETLNEQWNTAVLHRRSITYDFR